MFFCGSVMALSVLLLLSLLLLNMHQLAQQQALQDYRILLNQYILATEVSHRIRFLLHVLKMTYAWCSKTGNVAAVDILIAMYQVITSLSCASKAKLFCSVWLVLVLCSSDSMESHGLLWKHSVSYRSGWYPRLFGKLPWWNELVPTVLAFHVPYAHCEKDFVGTTHQNAEMIADFQVQFSFFFLAAWLFRHFLWPCHVKKNWPASACCIKGWI